MHRLLLCRVTLCDAYGGMNHRTRALLGLLCIAGLATGQLNQSYRPEFFSPGQGFQSVSAQISTSNGQQFKRQAPGGGAGGAGVIPHDQKKQTTFWWVAPDTPFKATKIGGGVQEPPGAGGDGEDGGAAAAAAAAAGGAAGVSQTAFQASAARTAAGQTGQTFGAGGTTTSIQSSTASRTIGTQTQGFQGGAAGGVAGAIGGTRSTISKSSTSSTFGSQGGLGQQGVIAGSSRTSSTTSNTQVNTGTVQPGVGAGGVRTSTIIRQSKTSTTTGVAPVPAPPPTTSIQSTTTGVRTDTITSNVNSPVPRTTVDVTKQTNVDTQRTNTIQTNLYPGQPGQPGSTSTSTVVGTATQTSGVTPNNYGGTTVTKTQERTDGGITSKVITTGTITRPFYKQTTLTSPPQTDGYNYPVPETVPCYEPNKLCAPNQFCNDGFVDESQLNLFNTNNQNCNSATEQCCKIRPTPATRCPDDSYVCVSPDLCNNGLLNFDAQNAISTRQP
uniref:Uncharacterized protein n=1 Tax=Anopheles dirus TaxID=7168 RepID=A0A182NUB0_9DIPT